MTWPRRIDVAGRLVDRDQWWQVAVVLVKRAGGRVTITAEEMGAVARGATMTAIKTNIDEIVLRLREPDVHHDCRAIERLDDPDPHICKRDRGHDEPPAHQCVCGHTWEATP